MNSENLETNNTWQPDPTWDYYLAWHSLQYAKSQIEKALTFMAEEEFGNATADEEIKQLLEPAKDKLTDIIDDELNFIDVNEDEETA
ncbi:hypothetical protein LC593_32615 [Nostoc sp. CHAB 5844]|nr:hypothetical protein [Nostoc sp. CHAB 5844]